MKNKESVNLLPGPASTWTSSVYSFMTRGILGTFSHYAKQYGPCYRLPLPFGNQAIILSHPDAVETVLRSDRENFPKGDVYDGARLLLGNGLVTSEGQLWQRNRKLAQPSFNNQHIEAYLKTMSECTKTLINQWNELGDGQIIDLHTSMSDLTLDIVGQTLFGQDLRHQSRVAGKAFSTALKGIGTRGPGNLSVPLWLPTPGNLSFLIARKKLNKLVKEVIKKFRDNKNKQNENTLLGSLMNARYDDGEGMSDSQLHDEVLTLYLAGYETTANMLTWAFYVLNNEPEIKARLNEELSTLPQDHISLADLKNLTYTSMFLSELLRLYSPVWTIARNIISPQQVCEYNIPNDKAFILISSYITHRLPEFWPDPEKFIPERFQPEENSKRHPFAYFPFSSGPRVCIGKHFSLYEAKLILALILREFNLSIKDADKIGYKSLGTFRPDRKIKAKLTFV